MRKKMVAIIACSLCTCILSNGVLAVSPTQSAVQPRTLETYYIDNDSNNPNCSNKRQGFNEYLSDTGHYNNDARRQLTNTQQGKTWYQWSFDGFSHKSPVYAYLGVYLNNKYFLDPAAEYAINVETDFSMYKVGTINQKYAKAGWTDTPKVYLPSESADGYVNSYLAELWPSGRKVTGYTGADAIRIVYSYNGL